MYISKDEFVKCAESITNIFESAHRASCNDYFYWRYIRTGVDIINSIYKMIDSLYEVTTDIFYTQSIIDICYMHCHYCVGGTDMMEDMIIESDASIHLLEIAKGIKSHSDFYDLISKAESEFSLHVSESNIVMFPESRILH